MYFVCFPNNTGIFITDILYNEEEAINQLTGSGFVLPYKQLKELHKTGSNIEQNQERNVEHAGLVVVIVLVIWIVYMAYMIYKEWK